MARGRNSNSNEEKDKKQCTKCLKHKIPSKDFYISHSSLHGDGRIPICKECLKTMFDEKYNGSNAHGAIEEIVKRIDRPYLKHIVDTSVESSVNKTEKTDHIFLIYMKNIAMGNYAGMTYKDSTTALQPQGQMQSDITFKKTSFILTDDIIDKWGEGYTSEEYSAFEKRWNKLIDNYGEKTSLHIEGLKTYIRFRIKEEMATAKGLVKDAKDWAALAKDAATAAKINVSQLSKSDISGGVDLLPQLFEAVESEVGIIPILPHLKEQPYDDADIIIWCVVNYIRRLEDKSRVQYREIWSFYDEMLIEHYKQKGYSDEMIEKEKVKRNNVFRDLGVVYKEPLYEEEDV